MPTDSVQLLQGNENGIAVFKQQFNDLLPSASVFLKFQAGEAAHPMVNMGNKITGLQFRQLSDGNGLLLAVP